MYKMCDYYNLTTTRLALMLLTNIFLQYMTSLSEIHFEVAKHVLRYLKGTLNFCIWFGNNKEINLHCYYDSD